MNLEFNIKTEHGYTLMETVVAMVLFLSVLIPLIGTMGTMMFDRKPVTTAKALMLAQSEMSSTVSRQEYIDATKTPEPGFIVIKKIIRYDKLVEIRITVKTSIDQSKELILLKKSIFRPNQAPSSVHRMILEHYWFLVT